MPIGWAAELTGRPYTTVRAWATTGKVKSIDNGVQTLVWLFDVQDVSEVTPRRRRATA